MNNQEEPTIKQLEDLLEETGFSPQAKEKIGEILVEVKKRGYLTAEEKIKLLEIVDADLFLDKMELEANEEVIKILQELKEKLER